MTPRMDACIIKKKKKKNLKASMIMAKILMKNPMLSVLIHRIAKVNVKNVDLRSTNNLRKRL